MLGRYDFQLSSSSFFASGSLLSKLLLVLQLNLFKYGSTSTSHVEAGALG